MKKKKMENLKITLRFEAFFNQLIGEGNLLQSLNSFPKSLANGRRCMQYFTIYRNHIQDTRRERRKGKEVKRKISMLLNCSIYTFHAQCTQKLDIR